MSDDSVYDIKPKVEENKNIEIAYYRPKFWKRVFAILFDAIICFILSVGTFIWVRDVVNVTTGLNKRNEDLNQIRLESGLFLYDVTANRVFDIVSYYNRTTDMSPSSIEHKLVEGINKFFTFVEDEVGATKREEAQKEYNDYLLDERFYYNNKPFFIKDENGLAIKNKGAEIPSEQYVKTIYAPYIDEFGQGLFYTIIPEVKEIQNENFLYFAACEVPVAIFIGFTLTYYVIPLCFSRGKQTLGRHFFNLGLVNKNVLSVGAGQFTIRYLILFFSEIVLSVFTFGVPLFISFTMMVFTKKKQNFHDYMLGIEEVDVEDSRIYKSKKEIDLPGDSCKYEDIKQR